MSTCRFRQWPRRRAAFGAPLPLAIRLSMLLLLATLARAAHAADPPALPALQADLSQTSVSGLSSGAFMAAQFAVAYSATVVGAGIIAGGPFYCAGYPGFAPFIPYLANAMASCMNPAQAHAPPPDASVSWQAANRFAQAGQIDATSNLRRQRVYLFSGTSDQTVTQQVVAQTARFYGLAGVPAAQIAYVDNVDAGHAIITADSHDVPCPATTVPYINDCHFLQAQDLLRFIYPGLNPPTSGALTGKLIPFNQRSFIHGPLSSMANTAYAYVPQACYQQRCKVHVAFHGCQQGAAAIGDHFYARAGYNPVADSNGIIVLYPQVEPSPLYPYNPKGCWDFWGYTSVNPFLPSFYAKDGVQMVAVMAMLQRLAGARSGMGH